MDAPVPVDRPSLVGRHGVHLRALDARAPLQVGNGSFAAAVDPTGLQTFPEAYPLAPSGTLLGTFATWGWHAFPGWFDLAETRREYTTAHGPAEYVDLSTDAHDAPGQTPAEAWLRENAHRLDLGRVGLWAPGIEHLDAGALADIDQRLDLWSGVVTSRFTLAGARYVVTTAAHPERDALAVRIEGPDRVGLRLRFPYASTAWGDAADWGAEDRHATAWSVDAGGVTIERTLDDTRHGVRVHAPGATVSGVGAHELVVRAPEAVVEFLPGSARAATRVGVADVFTASARSWAGFWSGGAAVDLSGSDHPAADELERRIVLSQYLTRVNSSGPLPPVETGLLCNSWRGKFHLEMHWFHSAHFAVWGRPEPLVRQLEWYRTILDVARATARRQGLPGARWPKQVDPSGRETPSSIGPFLVWQQPHLIHLVHLLGDVDRWRDLVDETAELMAAFAVGGDLGPPIVPAQESYHANRASDRNPTFELAYWQWALRVAARWRGRDDWRTVADRMTAPMQRDGRYVALATAPYLVRDDHPSMLAAYGFVPPTDLIDPGVMAATFDDVLADWNWESTWGWDYPVLAMTATRLGRPADAVAALLRDSPKNEYLRNGHNFQTPELPVYLPGNGALLAAVALMVSNGGFDSRWHVRAEEFAPRLSS